MLNVKASLADLLQDTQAGRVETGAISAKLGNSKYRVKMQNNRVITATSSLEKEIPLNSRVFIQATAGGRYIITTDMGILPIPTGKEMVING